MNRAIDMFKRLCKFLILFFMGGIIYYLIEILYRGYSHISMFLLGGLCFILIGLINVKFEWDMYLELQVLIGTGAVTLLEFITGLIVNVWLKLNVWDYSHQPLNIMGQVCVLFMIIWTPLVLAAIFLDDYTRYIIFNEEQPRYRSWILNKLKRK